MLFLLFFRTHFSTVQIYQIFLNVQVFLFATAIFNISRYAPSPYVLHKGLNDSVFSL